MINKPIKIQIYYVMPIYAYFTPLRDEELMKAVVKMRWEPKAMEFKEVPSPEVG